MLLPDYCPVSIPASFCSFEQKLFLSSSVKTDDAPLLQLFIKSLTGRTDTLTLSSEETGLQIKERIQNIQGIPIDQQRLYVYSIPLQNHMPLSYYKVKNGSTITLVLNLRGGMFHATSGRTGFDDIEMIVVCRSEERRVGKEGRSRW